MARHSVCSVLIMCVLVIVPALSLPSSTLSGENKKTFQQHYRRVRAFKCSLPRPTAVHVSSLHSAVEGATRVYIPPMTVLHRCDAGAGCCLASGHSCSVVDSRPVNLTFHVTHIMDTPGHPRGSASLVTLQAINHTRCDCIETFQPPRGHPEGDSFYMTDLNMSSNVIVIANST